MKITIEAETDQERAELNEPWVRTGVQVVGVAGFGTMELEDEGHPKGQFGFMNGPALAVKVELQRVLANVEAVLQRQLAFEGAVNAHNTIVKEAQRQATLRGVMGNGKGLRIRNQ